MFIHHHHSSCKLTKTPNSNLDPLKPISYPEMDAKTERLKVLMFPFLAHGHIFPFLELAKQLSSRNFHIYFCSTSINLHSVKNSLQNHSSFNKIQLVELPLPQLPPEYHTTKNTPQHLRPLLMQAFQDSSSTLSTLMDTLKPDLLVYDLFQPWSAKIAASQGIPAVHFFTGGSAAGSFMHHWYTHDSLDSFPFNEIRLRDHEKRALVASSQYVKVKDAQQGFAFGIFKLSSDVVLIKSCRGIEGKYMDYLSTLCERELVPTGPLVVVDEDKEEVGDPEIIKWLSGRERGSTLYISFGSENFLSKKQMMEIAKGLEMIDVDFIWVVRWPIGSEVSMEEMVPEGFVERTRKRGMVVERWAPQTAILAHKSVGGFMTHCGWSSISESLYFGVPVVAVPLKIDQPVNARLVVEMGAGVEVERDEEDGDFDGEAVAKAIGDVVVEGGEGMRQRVRELSHKMKMEQEEAMDEVARELSTICYRKK